MNKQTPEDDASCRVDSVVQVPVPISLPDDHLSPKFPVKHRVLTAVLYGLCASLIVIVNKIVLISYRFPSFLTLGLGQMVITVLILPALKAAGIVSFPWPTHKHVIRQVWPLPLLFFGTIVFSLGGTKRLSLQTYIVLRHFANLFIMLGEYLILGQVATPFTQFTVYLMILGATIAASDDLAFDTIGYLFVFATNICSSFSGVFAKQKLNTQTLDKFGLMFYNSLFMVIPTVLLAYFTGHLQQSAKFGGWSDPVFLGLFVMACSMGFMLTYSTLLCTQYNSALTTSIVGMFKNMFVVYSGMFVGGDYFYSFTSFLGIYVSMVGGVMYSYMTFSMKSSQPSQSSNDAS